MLSEFETALLEKDYGEFLRRNDLPADLDGRTIVIYWRENGAKLRTSTQICATVYHHEGMLTLSLPAASGAFAEAILGLGSAGDWHARARVDPVTELEIIRRAKRGKPTKKDEELLMLVEVKIL